MLIALQQGNDARHSTIQRKASSVDIKSEDSKIDTIDIPELTDEDWAKSEKNLFYHPNAILSRNKS